jgi:hypothetical protein
MKGRVRYSAKPFASFESARSPFSISIARPRAADGTSARGVEPRPCLPVAVAFITSAEVRGKLDLE